jgi:small-conductance mechanosensitive channel
MKDKLIVIQSISTWGTVAFRIAMIILISIILERTLRFLIGRFTKRSAELMNVDKTKYVFLKHVVTAVIYLFTAIAIIYSIPTFRTFAVSLFAGAGIIAAIIGFASQAAFANIISGVFMVMSRPFKVGDRIEIGKDYVGIVEDITLRHTVIRNYENKRIIMPNSKISAETIVNNNLYDDRIRRYIDFSIDYSSDIDKAMQLMRDICESHPLTIDGRTTEDIANQLPIVEVRLIGFGESEMKLRAYVWAANPINAFNLHTELNVLIKKGFDEQQVSIPFPQRVISYRYDQNDFKNNPETP